MFAINNREFKYEDALFETIRVINGSPCFLDNHFMRLEKGMTLLKMNPNPIFFDILKTQIVQLIEKNNINKGGRLRLTVYRSSDGFYTPEGEEKNEYAIEVVPLKENNYELNERGITIDIYREFKRHSNALSSIKTTNNIPLTLAGIYKREEELDDCIVLNDHNIIVQTISSNIFLYRNNNLYTPSLEEGCMDGVMRKQVLKAAKELRINISEGIINGSMLLQADELFLTNAIKGIEWVGAYRDKRYFNKTSKRILEQLNKLSADLVTS